MVATIYLHISIAMSSTYSPKNFVLVGAKVSTKIVEIICELSTQFPLNSLVLDSPVVQSPKLLGRPNIICLFAHTPDIHLFEERRRIETC